jgi:hypothetical protein
MGTVSLEPKPTTMKNASAYEHPVIVYKRMPGGKMGIAGVR